ncbi:MAG TPA: HAMP domain-containing sensor histidine kinase [Polyangiaceae bacterium]|nr:HAMP domain-containing sensor histidine kinase [Polyangiaceae bacterium]
MKIVARFLLAFVVVSAVCLAAYGYLAARSEAHDIEVDTLSDMAVLGDGLREGMIAAASLGGESAALAVVSSVGRRRTDVDVEFVPGAAASAQTSSVTASGEGRIVRIALPVTLPRGRDGTLSVAREIPSASHIFRQQLLQQFALVGFLVIAMGAIAVVLGATLIGRPLQRVVAQARRIGDGDLSERLAADGTDEIGVLMNELNAMCDRLVLAQKRGDEEAAARVETLEQLRHLDRLRMVGTIASSIAHELGTPLNVLLIRGQSLEQGDASADEVREAGNVVTAQVEKMSRIVRQLLDFSRRRTTTQETVRLSEIAQRAVRLLDSLAKKHGVALEVRIREDGTSMGNAEHLEQAVTNLVLNGIQAMPNGGQLVVEVRSDAAAQVPDSARVLPVGIIDVKDTGTGISKDDLERIFEPFYTTKPAGFGTGLGLPVANGVVVEHGGWITATSEPGRGSSFAICLPRAT